MTVADAIQLWRLQGKTYNRFKGRVGGPPKEVSMDDVRRAVIKQVDRIERLRRAEVGLEHGARHWQAIERPRRQN